MADDLGVEITAQGLDERLTDKAVDFLQTMAHKSLEWFRNEMPLDIELLQQFTAVDIVDSSIIALPDSLQDEYPGCGGDGPDASLKVQ